MLKTKQNLVQRIALRISSEALKLAKPMDSYLISRYEEQKKMKFPPVFIIGAPRTGSTLVFQLLTNYFDVKYISNFTAAFYHSLFFGMLLEDYVLGNSPHNVFKSNYGMAKSLKGPNECGQFWYRWFPGDRHFIGSHEYSKDELMGIRKTISAITKRFSKLLIFKNLNNGQRLQVIKKIFPESLFIFVKRETVFTAQSILAGRQDFYGDKNAWFSVMPKNVNELLRKNYPEQVVKQIYYLENQIVQDLKLFPDHQHIVVNYEEFCQNTFTELQRIGLFFRQNDIVVHNRKNVTLPKFSVDKNQLVSDEDLELIRKETDKINWVI